MKPMQIYNVDETSITVVHTHSKVFSAVERKHVYSLTSGEKGKTHGVVVRVGKWAHNPSPNEYTQGKGLFQSQ